MQRPTRLQTLYIDFDAFFATVEKQVNPPLRGRPVGVIAMESEYSALIAQCYMAKAMGCTRQMRVKDARKTCPDIKADLAADIGTEISPSIGLAANQLLAKICAEMEKPQSFVVLHPRDWPGKLLRVKLGDIPGIAGGNIVRLRRAGINSVPELLAISAKHARAIWGNVEGERLWAQLQGYSIEPLMTCSPPHAAKKHAKRFLWSAGSIPAIRTIEGFLI